MRAAFYLRLSVSHDTSTSIVRQREDLEALAEREGWDVTTVFADDGESGGKDRPNAREALRMLRAGEIDVLAVAKLDRWSRQGLGAVADLVAALDHREKAGDPALFVALADGLRSDQPAWRIIATVLAEIAREERRNTQYRTKSSIAKLKRSGRFSGGTVPVGFRTAPAPDGAGRVLVPDADEAAALTAAAEQIVAGSSVYAAVATLNASGVRPRRAASWSVQALGQALTGPAIVGRVTVDGEVLRGDDGLPAQVWPPAISLDLWHAVRSTLDDRRAAAPVVGERKPGRRSRLLSGLATCAECGAPLYVRRSSGKKGSDGVRQPGVAIYSCSARSNGRPCPGVIVTAERVEEHVEALYLRMVGHYAAVRPVVEETPAVDLIEAEASLAAVSARLTELDLDDADEERLLAQRRTLRARVRELRGAASSTPATVTFVETGRSFGEVWADAEGDLDARRELLAAAFSSIAIAKGRRGRTGLDPARVLVQMRQVPEDYDA